MGRFPAIDVKLKGVMAGRIDFRLVAGLARGEHGGGIEGLAVFPRQEFGGLEEDGGAVVPGHFCPIAFGLVCRIYGLVRVVFAGLVVGAEDLASVVGTTHFDDGVGMDLLSPDKARHLDRIVDHVLQSGFQLGAFGRSRRERQNRFIFWFWNIEETVEHHLLLSRLANAGAPLRRTHGPLHVNDRTA